MKRKLINTDNISTGFISKIEYENKASEKDIFIKMCLFSPYISDSTLTKPSAKQIKIKGVDGATDSKKSECFSQYYKTLDAYLADRAKAMKLLDAGERIPMVLFYKLRLTYWEIIKFQVD